MIITSGVSLFLLFGCGAGLVETIASPSIIQVLPQTIAAGSQSLTMKVTGTNFTNKAVILWNGKALATSLLDAGTLTGTIGSSIVAMPATVQLQVQDMQTSQTSSPVPVVVAAAAATQSPAPLPVVSSGSQPVVSAPVPSPAGSVPVGTPVATPVAGSSPPVSSTAPLTVSPDALPLGTDGVEYESSLQAGGGKPPYTWTITAGALPPGVTLGASSGLLTGTPGTAGTYSFTAMASDQSVPAQTKSVAAAIVVGASKSASDKTYYVANNGNDSNSGTSTSSPWKTIGKVNAVMASLGPGDSVLLHSGDVFRDDYLRCVNLTRASPGMTVSGSPPACSGSASAPVTIGAYGSSNVAPVIDGADPLALTWVLVHGTTWEAKVSGALPSKLYVDSATTSAAQLLPVPNMVGEYNPAVTYHAYDAVTEDGTLYVRGPVAPSAGIDPSNLVTWINVVREKGATSQDFSMTNNGLENVEATPGSWYGTGSTIYVNLADGSSPGKHTFEGTQRPYGVLLEGVNYVTVSGLTVEHVQHSGIASIPFSSDFRSYFVGEYNRIVNNHVWNYGSIVTDNLTLQEHNNADEAGILIRTDGSYGPHLVRGNYIGENNVGIMDCYYGMLQQEYQGGIMASGVDGGGTANDIVIEKNYVSTVNARGIVYNTIGTYMTGETLLNNGGRVTNNELVNNQGNLYFTATAGGMEDHNLIHHSYGEGVQTGGGSTSTAAVPQTHAYDVIYHLGMSASAQLFNGFDCKAGLSGGYWNNNTVYDTNSASITLETGCDSAHVHNNIFDQNALRFPTYDKINPSYLLYFVAGSEENVDFSHNIWVNGAYWKPFFSKQGYFNLLTFFSGWPDKDSFQVTDPGFTNPAANDFTLLPNSPAIGAGENGTTIGALP